MTRVVVIGAHPDDEAVGCGGTIRLHALAGDDVRAVFLTSGEAGGHGISNPARVREAEARTAAEILGLADVEFWREPDSRLRARRQLVERIASRLRRHRAKVVYAPHGADDHPDHGAAARIAREAVAASGRTIELHHFEIWSPIGEIDHVVDISEVIEVKLQAIRAYRSQCAVMAFDEAFRGLARYRGEMHSWPGGAYAEAFSSR